jgi:uncharacterized protein (TIGR02246 family)
MPKAIFTAAIGLFLLGADLPPGRVEDSKKPIADVLDLYAKACREEDIKSLAEVFAQDEDLVLILAVEPGNLIGWNQVEMGYKSWFQQAEHIQMDHTDVKIKMDPSAKASWVSGIQDLQFTAGGRKTSFKGVRFTWGLEQRRGKWVVVQAHWSSPPRDL